MERLVIYDAKELDCSPLYELSHSDKHLTIGERSHPLTLETADETATMAAVFVSSRVDRRVLQRMPHLKLILALSTGTNHIDLMECAKRDITVCNAPGYSDDTLAEYTLGLMLGLTRRIPEAAERLHHGQANHADLVGMDLAGKTLTVIGAGRIGRNVIRLAHAFRMEVLAVDPVTDHVAATEIGFEYTGLHDGLRRADIISLHAPYTPDNRHILNRHSLTATKPGVLIINTARGELINATALLHALHTGQVGGAALDVIEGEEHLGGHMEVSVLADGRAEHQVVREIAEHEALLKLPNVIITNHNGYNSREAQARLTAITVNNINAYLAGQPVNVATPTLARTL